VRGFGLAAIVLWVCLALPSLGAVGQDVSTESPVVVRAEPMELAPYSSGEKRFGRLDWLGGVRLVSEDSRFGGFSGLVVSRDGGRLVAMSDRGWWLAGDLVREDSRLTGFAHALMAPLLGPDGRRQRSHTRRDAEALAAWDERGPDGRLMVGFEQRVRVELFDIARYGFAARPKILESPREIAAGPNNQQLEALGRFVEGPDKGSIIALSEANFDKDGNIRGWMWNERNVRAFSIRRHADYLVTDLAILPGGKEIVTVERSFSLPLPPGMAIRLFRVDDLAAGGAAGEVLFEGRRPLYAIDNMEAIAAHRAAAGRTVLTLMSDDNYFRSIQSTILIEFAISPR